MGVTGKHSRQKRKKRRHGTAAAFVAAALLLGLIQSGCAGTDSGKPAAEAASSIAEESAAVSEAEPSSLEESAVVSEAESPSLEEPEAWPSSFDLRNVDTDGDGAGDRCYVTPVRSQRPLGDCWAFAVTAAAETSLLSSVLENDPEAYKTLDLSEKQLAYFASMPIDDPNHPQNKEGTAVVEIHDAHDIYDEGDTLLPASVYAMGVGPVLEGDDPNYEYRGREGVIAQEKDADGNLYDYSYSVDDDWTLEESYRFRQDYILTDAYELPCPNGSPSGEQDDPEYLYNEKGTAAIKEQLLHKHAVAIGFHSDSSKPWETGEKGEYMNTAAWAHYTWQRGMAAPTNHAVTIIGWDDNYPASNFLEGYQPPEDGAWLVKNSWGSGENEFPNRATGMWGLPVDPDDPAKGGSGYFWLSYYDQSISLPTVYLFDYSLFGADAESGFDPKTVVRNQHDCMPINLITPLPCEGEAKMSNVFTAETAQTLTALSFMTDAPDTAVTHKLYLLEQGFQSPEDGVLAAEGEAVFDYLGIHMAALTEPVPVAEGQMFSIVVTYRMADGTYAFAAPVSSGMDSPNVKEGIFSRYSKAVIGPGESYLCRDGSWTDMASEDGLITLLGDPDMLTEIKEYDYQVDNFNIKAYGIAK